MGVLMLEHWLGRMTRKDLGTKLNLPPLRVWQMSQQALAGMVVGLMAQPKRPPKGTPMANQTPKQDRQGRAEDPAQGEWHELGGRTTGC